MNIIAIALFEKLIRNKFNYLKLSEQNHKNL